MSSSLTMPSGGIREITWMPQTTVARTESPFSLAQQVHKFPGQRRMVKVKLPAMTAADARNWIAFFAHLNGPERTFFLSDTVGQNPSLSRGTPVVNGASQTGRSLVYDGGAASSTVVAAGEWVSIGNRLHQAVETSTADGSGDGTMKLWPEIQTSPPDNAPIEVDSPRGVFRLTELPAYAWSVNRLMQGVQFRAVEVVTQEILDMLNTQAHIACSNIRNLYGSFSGPRYLSTSKIYDQSGSGNDAFPNADGSAVTLESDKSWSFPTTTTKAMLNFGSDLKGYDLPDNTSLFCVIDTSSNNQIILSRGSTGNDWLGRWRTSGSTSSSESGVSVGDYRVNGTVVSPKNAGGLFTDANGAGKIVFSAESIEMTAMSGTLAFGVQNSTYGFKGKLYELILIPDLSADLRTALIENMKTAHGIS